MCIQCAACAHTNNILATCTSSISGSISGPEIKLPFRSGITCRERLEHCDAALCPSVAYQLSGAKKVQQDLARPEVLERFLDDKEQVDLIRACFAGTIVPLINNNNKNVFQLLMS